jgi:hypothetical protein
LILITIAIFRASDCRRTNASDFGCWAANHADIAKACRTLIYDSAKCIRTAWIVFTWIFTFIVNACLIRRTIAIEMAPENTFVAEANVSEEAIVIDATS